MVRSETIDTASVLFMRREFAKHVPHVRAETFSEIVRFWVNWPQDPQPRAAVSLIFRKLYAVPPVPRRKMKAAQLEADFSKDRSSHTQKTIRVHGSHKFLCRPSLERMVISSSSR